MVNNNYKFDNLGLIVIDEEQKFGVRDRNKILNDYNNLDLLVMSATCIPRTALLIKLLDIDVNGINDRLSKRQVTTHIVNNIEERKKMNDFILNNVSKKNQLIIICPAILEDSKLLSVEKVIERLKKIPNLKFKAIHSKNDNNEEIIKEFSQNKFEILVSTTIIEVGIDIPNANNIIIYHADRFGISNLQQLRGRIARHDMIGHCFLVSDNVNAIEKLNYFKENSDGIDLVEYDLKNRGAGELLGIVQSGKVDLPQAIMNNSKLLDDLRKDSNLILNNINNYKELKEYLLYQKIDLN